MLAAVLISVLSAIALAAILLAPRLVPRRIRLDGAPDAPRSFGAEMSWLAVKTTDGAALAGLLDLDTLRPANWNSGVGAIYDRDLADSHVFVSPPIKGWTIVAGVPLPMPAGMAFVDKLTPLLDRLARDFPNVQYFATFPIIDFFAWSRYERGRPVRTFAIGEAGVVLNHGRLTTEERRLGLSMTEVRGIHGRVGDVGGEIHLHPTEQHVLTLASGWSLNPMTIEGAALDASAGLVGRAPAAWRPERRRRVA